MQLGRQMEIAEFEADERDSQGSDADQDRHFPAEEEHQFESDRHKTEADVAALQNSSRSSSIAPTTFVRVKAVCVYLESEFAQRSL